MKYFLNFFDPDINMKNSICCVFNVAAHYRAPIYRLMDKEIGCDFFIGDKVGTPLEKMDYHELKGFKGVLKYNSLFGNFYWQRGAVKLVFRPYSDFILTGEPYCVSTWVILLIARLTGKRTFVWTHGWYGDETYSKRLVKKAFFNLATKLFLYGDYSVKLLKNEGFNYNRLVPIYNSLDYDKLYTMRGLDLVSDIFFNRFGNHYPVLLYIGRIQKVKKLNLLVEALNKLNSSGIGCNLIIIGEDKENVKLETDILRHNLQQKVWMYGPCYDEKIIAELIYNASVCVSPGNVGLTAIHSLSYGTPVITHNNFSNQMPEFEAIQPNETGDFFVEDDVLDLTNKVQKWIQISSPNRDLIRKECYRIIDEKYNPHNQIQIIKKTLKCID